jgi:iron(III) transport system permease protein
LTGIFNQLNRTSTKRLFPSGAIIDEVVSAIARLVEPLRDGKTIALLLFSCLLVYLVIVPLAVLVFGSFKAVAPGTQDYFTLNLTLENYARAFPSRHLPKATVNTAIFAIGSSTIAFVLGTFLAWVTERTNSPFRSLLYVMAISRVILPGVLVTFSWIVLLSPEIGILNRLLIAGFGLNQAPFNVYSMAGLIWVEGIELTPLAYLLMASAFRSMDPSLEEAAMVAGSGALQILRRITLPMMQPALLSTLVLLVIRGIESFETPALIGLRASIFVYTTEIWLNSTRAPMDYGLAGAYSMVLVIISALLILVYLRLTSHTEKFMTITGKGYRPRLVDLGKWRFLSAAASLLILFLVFVVPMITVTWMSLVPSYLASSLEGLQRISFKAYRDALLFPLTLQGIQNSMILGIASASGVTLITAVIAYIVVKTKLRGRGVLDFLAFVPYVVPGIIFGLSILWFYLNVMPFLYGTLTILLLAYLGKYLPVAMRINVACMAQVHSDLEEAAATCQSSWGRSFVKITLPLIRPGLVAAWIWVFVHSFREIPTAMILAYPGTEPVGIVMFKYWEDSTYQRLAAFGVMLFAVLLVTSLIAMRIGKRFGVRDG